MLVTLASRLGCPNFLLFLKCYHPVDLYYVITHTMDIRVIKYYSNWNYLTFWLYLSVENVM